MGSLGAPASDPGDSASAPLVPRGPRGRVASLEALATAARRCKACPLWEPATQTVFGEGPAGAPFMLVGEQPGDREDLAGRPFVGPAGGLLERALAEAGIDRAAVYVTNAVKHFSFEVRGEQTHPPKTQGARGQGVQGLAGRGDRGGGPAPGGLSGRHRRPGTVRPRLPPDQGARQGSTGCGRRPCVAGHLPPVPPCCARRTKNHAAPCTATWWRICGRPPATSRARDR